MVLCIAVYDEAGREVGYLLRDNQQFYPMTLQDEDLGRSFFHKDKAEAFLREYVAAQESRTAIDPIIEEILSSSAEPAA